MAAKKKAKKKSCPSGMRRIRIKAHMGCVPKKKKARKGGKRK